MNVWGGIVATDGSALYNFSAFFFLVLLWIILDNNVLLCVCGHVCVSAPEAAMAEARKATGRSEPAFCACIF